MVPHAQGQQYAPPCVNNNYLLMSNMGLRNPAVALNHARTLTCYSSSIPGNHEAARKTAVSSNSLQAQNKH